MSEGRSAAVSRALLNATIFGLIIVGAITLALRADAVRAAIQVNRAGILALRACLDGIGGQAAPVEKGDGRLAWFQGVAARCAGDQLAEQSAWQSVLSASDERLQLLRAFRPNDEQLARLAVRSYPENGSAYIWMADIEFVQGRLNEAILLYQQGLRYLPDDGLAWRKLGDLYNHQGDWQSAVHAYDQACAYVDAGKNGCLLAAETYLAHGQPAEAEQRYRASIVQLPYVISTRWRLIQVLLMQGKCYEALPYLKDFARQGDEKAIQMLADLGCSSP